MSVENGWEEYQGRVLGNNGGIEEGHWEHSDEPQQIERYHLEHPLVDIIRELAPLAELLELGEGGSQDSDIEQLGKLVFGSELPQTFSKDQK